MMSTADVIIVGAGIVGNSTAYYLAKRGCSVIVLEGDKNVGNGASSRNGGGVRQSGRDARELPLMQYGVKNIWPHISEELGYDCEYHQDGNLRLGKTEKHLQILKKLAVSEDDIVTYLELVTIRSKMHDPMTADVDTEVSANEKDQTRVTIVKVSTEGTEKDDDGNTIDLTDEEKAQKKDLAQQVLDKVKASDDVANADMDALAKEVDDSLSATAPAFTTAGSTDDTLDEAVQDAALELKDGEVADSVIEGDDGYYVVRLDKMLDEDATENKEKTVISERKSDLFDSTLEDWVKEEKIKVKDKVWDQITVTDSVSFVYKSADSSDDTESSDAQDSTEDTSSQDNSEDTTTEDTAAEDSAE